MIAWAIVLSYFAIGTVLGRLEFVNILGSAKRTQGAAYGSTVSWTHEMEVAFWVAICTIPCWLFIFPVRRFLLAPTPHEKTKELEERQRVAKAELAKLEREFKRHSSAKEYANAAIAKSDADSIGDGMRGPENWW